MMNKLSGRIKNIFFVLLVIVAISPTQNRILEPNIPTEKSISPPEMIFIKGGEFQMGDTRYSGREDEFPVHKIFLSDFYISVYEVSIKTWKDIMGGNSRKTDSINPVDKVSWDEAVQFCNMLSEELGLTPVYIFNGTDITCNFDADGYRLPTEAEWEFAAKGGLLSKNYIYSGSDKADSVAWTGEEKPRKPQPIGVKKANELGIFDMSGNLAEWCWDYYNKNYYKYSEYKNPSGPTRGRARILRGGSWIFNSIFAKTSYRLSDNPDTKNYHYGFRLVRKVNKQDIIK